MHKSAATLLWASGAKPPEVTKETGGALCLGAGWVIAMSSARKSAEPGVDPRIERITDVGKDRTHPRGYLAAVGVVGRQIIEDKPSTTKDICGTVHDASHPAQKKCAEAHQARFKARVARHLTRPRPQLDWDHGKGLLLGMATRLVTLAQNSGASLSHTAVVEGDEATHRNVPARLSFECEFDRSFDQAYVGAGPRGDASNSISHLTEPDHRPTDVATGEDMWVIRSRFGTRLFVEYCQYLGQGLG